MTSSWTRFLENPARAEHAAQVYKDVAELAGSVGAYLAAGFERGEPAIVIVTPAHWTAIEARLRNGGWRADELERSRLLTRLDADATLALLMVGEHPAPGRFLQVLGHLLDELAETFPGRRVRAFGEMVDMLAKRGDMDSAAELEDLWNALLHSRRFSLLCGYQTDVFDREAQASLLPEVRRTHSHVQPGVDPARLHRAVDSAFAEVLGKEASKVYALANPPQADESVPVAERALTWVSAEMPAHAERILAHARAGYAATA